MGAKQSKRSVDITTTPKKGEAESPMEGEGKVEKIEDAEGKVTTNGTLAHTEIEFADKEEAEEETPAVVAAGAGDETEVKENGVPEPDTPEEATPTTPEKTEKKESCENLNDTESTEQTAGKTNSEKKPEKEKKKKDKTKWLLKSLSFSKKDKSKKEEKSGKAKEENEIYTWKFLAREHLHYFLNKSAKQDLLNRIQKEFK